MMAYRPQVSVGDAPPSSMSFNIPNGSALQGDTALRLERLAAQQGLCFNSDVSRLSLATLEAEMAARTVMAARLRAAQQVQDLRELHTMGPSSPMLHRPKFPRIVSPVKASQPSSPIKGLDLLRSVTVNLPDAMDISSSGSLPPPPLVSGGGGAPERNRSGARSPTGRVYVDEIREWDVLCGRGGRSNHHGGNKRYRHVISEMKMMYRTTEAKAVKTDLSRAIVEHVCNYGGRFIKRDEESGRYFVLTKAEARKKTSQALRETKELKWTI